MQHRLAELRGRAQHLAQRLGIGDDLDLLGTDPALSLDMTYDPSYYHGVEHALLVGLLAVQGFWATIGRIPRHPGNPELGAEPRGGIPRSPAALLMQRALLVAGIWHDAGHSLDAGVPDAENIERAVALLPRVHGVEPAMLVGLVRATLHDSTMGLHQVRRRGALVHILRDADLLSSLHMVWAPQHGVAQRLRNEGSTTAMEPEDFFTGPRMLTHWGAAEVNRILGTDVTTAITPVGLRLPLPLDLSGSISDEMYAATVQELREATAPAPRSTKKTP